MDITHQRLQEFMFVAARLLQNVDPPQGSGRFVYALQKVQRSARPLFEDYSERQQDIQVACAEEKDGLLLRDNRDQLQYSKEGLLERNAQFRALSREVVSVTPFLCPVLSIPATLTPADRQVLEGLVIPEPDPPSDDV